MRDIVSVSTKPYPGGHLDLLFEVCPNVVAGKCACQPDAVGNLPHEVECVGGVLPAKAGAVATNHAKERRLLWQPAAEPTPDAKLASLVGAAATQTAGEIAVKVEAMSAAAAKPEPAL